MTEQRGPAGPQFHADRPQEQEAVRTTIVGGRPPGSGQGVGNIPRGIEVLIKKAVVDPSFRELLLDRRAAAADEIGLQLEPAEATMLAAAPRAQLETVIANTRVPEEHRRVFLGKVAAAMFAAIGIVATSCSPASKGDRPDRPPTKGINPDRPTPAGIKPEPPPAIEDAPKPSPSRGIRPDRPPTAEPGNDRPPTAEASNDRPYKEGTIVAGIGFEREKKRAPNIVDPRGETTGK
jgi:hypothetical protein